MRLCFENRCPIVWASQKRGPCATFSRPAPFGREVRPNGKSSNSPPVALPFDQIALKTPRLASSKLLAAKTHRAFSTLLIMAQPKHRLNFGSNQSTMPVGEVAMQSKTVPNLIIYIGTCNRPFSCQLNTSTASANCGSGIPSVFWEPAVGPVAIRIKQDYAKGPILDVLLAKAASIDSANLRRAQRLEFRQKKPSGTSRKERNL